MKMARTSKLGLFDESKGFRIRWIDPEDGEEGGAVGDARDEYKKAPDPNKDRDAWEVYIVETALKDLDPKPEFDLEGYFWDNKREAHAAFRIAKAALEQEKPMPDWAKKAVAEGWKPPRGWKP